MMDSFLTLVGNLTGDPALGRTATGTPVCRFRIAANERIFDRGSGQWRDGAVLYLPVICWRRLAENVARSLRRGDPVAVVGRLRQWRGDQTGALQTEVAAEVVAADLSRRVVRLLPLRPTETDRESGRGSEAGPPLAAGSAAGPPAAAVVSVGPPASAGTVAGLPPGAERRPGEDTDVAGAASRAPAAEEPAAESAPDASASDESAAA
jgi:single-strand DNA-binding protein